MHSLVDTRTVLLDGGLGTELEARGMALDLPLWSARAVIENPGLLWEIHRDFVAAGVDVLTACTFRTSRWTLRKLELEKRAGELTLAAVRLARSATTETDRQVLIAGCIGPLEDCYEPEHTPDDETLRREHTHHASQLAQAGVDLLFLETHNSAREALIAAEAASGWHLPVWISLQPKSASEIFNGDDLVPLAKKLFESGVEAVLLNCAPPAVIESAYSTLRAQFPSALLGVYPNIMSDPLSPHEFAAWAHHMRERGANIIGGCCGVGPEQIAAANSVLSNHIPANNT